jgi:hypothetical protein
MITLTRRCKRLRTLVLLEKKFFEFFKEENPSEELFNDFKTTLHEVFSKQ